jgi:hypothetical protein
VPGICLIGGKLRRASSRDDYGFGIVGLVGAAARAQGVVVVIEQKQPPVFQGEDALDGLEGEREQVPEVDVAFSFELRDPVKVPDIEQI